LRVVSDRRLTFADGTVWDLSSRTHVLGILNVTPDSFSDGGQYLDEGRAAARAAEMAAEGADAIDIGGESTRPGSEQVPLALERERVIPVLRRVRAEQPRLRISIDTTKAALAREALDEGADLINDVSGMTFDPEMPATVSRSKAPCVLMHMRGNPRTMQDNPVYDDVVAEIGIALQRAIERATAAGIAREAIILDPGIGFGKTAGHNIEILRRLPELRSLGQPLLVGVSRKSFIGALTGLPSGERLEGSLGAAAAAILAGASLLRVHDVSPTVRMVRVVDALVERN
jgi:dihydropteroate synthase